MFATDIQSNQSGDDSTQRFDGEPQTIIRELWLDLENTIITPVVEGWWKTELINLDKIREVISGFAPHTVNIFSFALWNDKERAKFSEAVQPLIEQQLGVKLNCIPTVDDGIIPICCKKLGLVKETVDFQEMSNFWGKQGAFRIFAEDRVEQHRRHTKAQIHMLLLDDVVSDERLQLIRLRAIIEQRNIDTL